jgi:molybdopterin molybdotransferase
VNQKQVFKNPSWLEARSIAYQVAETKAAIEVTLSEALRKTLAADLQTLHPLPPFNTAMMDGYAVKGKGPWEIVGEVLAGSESLEFKSGQAVYIATGAKVPEAAELVIKHEDVLINNNIVEPLDWNKNVIGQHIRTIGDEASTGDAVLVKGKRINPAVLGLAALSGLDQIKVINNPTVDSIVSGDELLNEGLPRNGKIRDVLSLQIPGWVNSLDAINNQQFKIGDNLEETVAAINECKSDLILTTGGTARGNVDFMHEALVQCGFEILIDEVAIRPGHPMLLAKNSNSQFLVGLPGNPLAACVAFLTLAQPLIEKLQGRELTKLQTGTLISKANIPKKEMRLVPVIVENNLVEPQQYWGSMMLRGLAASTHFALIKSGQGIADEIVELLPLPWKV